MMIPRRALGFDAASRRVASSSLSSCKQHASTLGLLLPVLTDACFAHEGLIKVHALVVSMPEALQLVFSFGVTKVLLPNMRRPPVTRCEITTELLASGSQVSLPLVVHSSIPMLHSSLFEFAAKPC